MVNTTYSTSYKSDADNKYQNTDINGQTLAIGDMVTIKDKLCIHNGYVGEIIKLSNYLDWHGKVVYNATVVIKEDKRCLEFLYWPAQLEKKGK